VEFLRSGQRLVAVCSRTDHQQARIRGEDAPEDAPGKSTIIHDQDA
jgi:hypothetical protein